MPAAARALRTTRHRRCRTVQGSCRRSQPSRRHSARRASGRSKMTPASATGRQPRPICHAAEVAPGSWIGHFFRKMVPNAKPIAPPSASKMPGSFARPSDISTPPNSNTRPANAMKSAATRSQRHPFAEQRPREQGGPQRAGVGDDGCFARRAETPARSPSPPSRARRSGAAETQRRNH